MNFAIMISIGASLAATVAASPSATQAAPAGSAAVLPAERERPALSDTELDHNRGGQASVAAMQNVSADANDNVINGNYAAGSVTISGNALSNFSGIGNIAINTGAQVNLLSVMNLTITTAP